MKKIFKLGIFCLLLLGNQGCPTELDMFMMFDKAIIYHHETLGQTPLIGIENYENSIPRRIASCKSPNEIKMCWFNKVAIEIPFVILNQTTQLCEYRRVRLPRGWLESYEVLQAIRKDLITEDPIFEQDKRACDLPQPLRTE
jgi:hypothetical protein